MATDRYPGPDQQALIIRSEWLLFPLHHSHVHWRATRHFRPSCGNRSAPTPSANRPPSYLKVPITSRSKVLRRARRQEFPSTMICSRRFRRSLKAATYGREVRAVGWSSARHRVRGRHSARPGASGADGGNSSANSAQPRDVLRRRGFAATSHRPPDLG